MTVVDSGIYDVLFWSVSGAEHDTIHPGSGQADTEGSAVCREDGDPVAWLGDQIPAGGGESQAEHCQAIQGVPRHPKPQMVIVQWT